MLRPKPWPNKLKKKKIKLTRTTKSRLKRKLQINVKHYCYHNDRRKFVSHYNMNALSIQHTEFGDHKDLPI